jgi:hypothetical protein
MKPDEFEQQLQHRPWRPMPPEWRTEILGSARQSLAADGTRRTNANAESPVRSRLAETPAKRGSPARTNTEALAGLGSSEALAPAKFSAAGERRTPAAASRAWWRALLWPCPQAWGGLAGIWLLALIIGAASSSPARPSEVTVRVLPPSPEVREAVAERRRLFAELIGVTSRPAEADRPFVPRPRSERRIAIIYV